MLKFIILILKKLLTKLDKTTVIINVDDDRKRLEELYEQIQVGDIYYAKMPLSEDLLLQIEPSHRIRPYLIVKKENHQIFAYSGSSNKPYKLKNYKYIKLDLNLYKTGKTTYIYLDQFYKLPIENIYTYMTSLYPKTKEEVDKRLSISNRHGHHLPTFETFFPLTIGDIISIEGNLYYIYQEDNSLLYTHPVYYKSLKDIDSINVKVNHQELYFSYNLQVQMNAKEQYTLIASLTLEQQQYISNRKKELKQKKKNKKTQQKILKYHLKYIPGQIITNDEADFIYLYSIDEKHYGIFVQELYDDFPRIFRIKNKDIVAKNTKISLIDLLSVTYRLIEININPHGVLKQYYQYLITLPQEETPTYS